MQQRRANIVNSQFSFGNETEGLFQGTLYKSYAHKNG